MSRRSRVWRRAALALYFASIPATLTSAWAYGAMLAEAQALHTAQSRLFSAKEAADNELRGRK